MRLRGAIVIGVLAALLGAPPTASAAANVLLSPVVAPASGTPSTVFVLGVTYDGDFPAARVDAAVGAKILPMKLVRGTPLAGRWEVSTTLASGSWPVTFLAVTDRGNSPALAAGAIVVLARGPSAPSPSPAPTPQSSAERGTERTRSSADIPTPLPPSAAPEPAPAEQDPPADDPPQDTSSEPPVQPSVTAGRAGTADGGQGAGPAAAPTGSHVASPVASPSAGAVTPPPSGPGSTQGPRNRGPAEDGAPTEGRPPPADAAETTGETLGDAVAILSGWAAMLAVACGLIGLFVVRRRSRSRPLPATASLADETAALLERRALRRARTVLPDDPIIASLRIDDAALARRSTERMRRQRPPDGPT